MRFYSAFCTTTVFVASGCTFLFGNDAEQPLGSVLANVVEQSLAEDCAAGGVDIAIGVDLNADGDLSVDEIDRIVTVCNGRAG